MSEAQAVLDDRSDTVERHGRSRRRHLHSSTASGERHVRDVLLAAVFAITGSFYLWTIATSGTRADFGGDAADYFGELTTAFLKGHLSLLMKPAAALLALPDPYSSAENGPWRSAVADLALYHGHFFLDWGPTPVVTLYVPWRLVGLGDIPESWALFIFSVLGLGFSLLLLRRLVKDYAPTVRTWQVVLAAFALSIGNVVPFIDRTPDVYEVGVASAYCFASLGLFLLARGALHGRRRAPSIAGGSLCFGLAAGARWDLLLLAPLLVALLFGLIHRDAVRSWAIRARLAATLLGPCGFIIALLLIYNYARFGSFFQVGTSYQLAGFDPTKTPYYLLGYLWPSLYYYVIAPVRLSIVFPYFALPPPPAYPGAVPATYSPELIGGIFSTTPILLMLLAAPLALRKRVPREWTWVTVALILDTIAIIALLALGIPGGSMRYEVDFATLVLIPALMIWLIWQPTRPLLRIAVHVGGTVLILIGCLVGYAISLWGYHGQILRTAPGDVSALRSMTQPIANLALRIVGHPEIIGAGCDGGMTLGPRYNTLGVGSIVYLNIAPGPCTFTVVDPTTSTWTLYLSEGPGPDYALAANRPISIAVGADGVTHRYMYAPGGNDYPVALHAGTNTVTLTLSIHGAKSLTSSSAVLSGSELTIGAPEIHP